MGMVNKFGFFIFRFILVLIFFFILRLILGEVVLFLFLVFDIFFSFWIVSVLMFGRNILMLCLVFIICLIFIFINEFIFKFRSVDLGFKEEGFCEFKKNEMKKI